MTDTLRSKDELDLIDAVLGSHHHDKQALEDFKEAATINTIRKALLRVLREFDELCAAHDIKYFLCKSSLRGAVVYGDFVPGSKELPIGMLRGEYLRFVDAYKQAEAKAGGVPFPFWHLIGYGYANSDAAYRLPHLQVSRPVFVEHNGNTVYGPGSLPLQVQPFVEISVFDEVPDDFFTRKKFFRQMKRRNDAYNRINVARELLFRRFDPELEKVGALAGRYKNMSWWRAIRWGVLPLRAAYRSVHRLAQRYNGRGMQQVTRVIGDRTKTVPLAYLGACPRMGFAGLQVRVPETPDIWAREPVLETTPELKRLQDDAKVIVVEIDRICQELGITYFACGGTMLGYVRHGGFIPWDDDIDIGMLRADYERFKAEAGALIDTERFFLQTRETDPNIPYLFSKVRLEDSEYITEYNKDRDFHKGICVDIFPFDYIPNDIPGQVAFKGRAKKAARAHNRIVNRQYPEASIQPPEGVRRDLDFRIAQMNGKLLVHHYWSKDLNVTQQAYDETVGAYNAQAKERGLAYVASFVPTYTMARVDDLLPVQRVDFEGIQINIPRRPELFLAMQYSDYMQLPYPHQRMGHDLLLWSDTDGVGGGRDVDVDRGDEAQPQG